MTLNFFVNYVLPPLIIILGLYGNSIGLIIVGKKKLKQIGPVFIYKCLFISDNIYLSIILFFLFYLFFFFINITFKY